MKRVIMIVFAFCLVLAIPHLVAQSQDDLKAFKDKVNQKIAQMKAAGASEEEIQKFVTEAKKKYEAKMAEQTECCPEQQMQKVKQEIEKKVQEMKASGASEQEIQKFVTEAKKKYEAKMAAQTVIQLDPQMQKEKEEFEKKIQEMKAAGASDEQIKEAVKAFKQRMEETAKTAKKMQF